MKPIWFLGLFAKKKKDNLSVAALVKLCILQIVPWAKKIKNEESENIE